MTIAQMTIGRKQLSDALARIDRTISHKSPREALQCLKISLNGHARICATDLESSHIENLQCDHTGELDVIVNAKQFRKMVTTSKQRDVTITICESQTAVDFAKLKTGELESFPAIELEQAGESNVIASFETTGHQLASMLNFVSVATDLSSTRFALGGILFEFCDDNVFRVIASDGRRLHAAATDSSLSHDCKHSAIVYSPHCELIAMAANKCDLVKIELTNDGYSEVAKQPINERIRVKCFRVGDLVSEFAFRLVNGRFPNWRQVIPSGHAEMAVVNQQLANKTFSQASKQIPRKCEHHGTRVTLANNLIQLAYTSPDLQFELACDCVTLASESIAVQLDCHFMADGVAMPVDSISIRMADGVDDDGRKKLASNSPALFIGADNGIVYRAVIMPMAID